MLLLTRSVRALVTRFMVYFVLLLVSSQVAAVHSVVWDRTVIRLNLSVGVEQVLFFPNDAAVGLSPTLANADVFRTLSAGQTVYWTALQAFSGERVKVRLSSGEYVLFDVSAIVEKKPPKQVDPINVVVNSMAQENDSGDVQQQQSQINQASTIFDLIRYGAQSIYSPARLVYPLPGIREAPVVLGGDISALYQSPNKKTSLLLSPVKSWVLNGIYVTAIAVKNQSNRVVELDNRHVKHTRESSRSGVGRHFIASSFYQQQLRPRDEPGDRTTLFIVTDKPFGASLRL